MIKIQFSEDQINLLFEEKEKSKHSLVRKKADVLILKSLGFPHKDIQKITRISRPTLASYLKEFRDGDLDKIKNLNFYRPTSKLDEFKEVVKDYFTDHPPQNSAEASQKIEEITGIKRSPSQIRAFLKRIGMKIRKVGYVPGKQTDTEKQKEQDEFKKKL